VRSVSEVLERGLAALIEDELERIHVEGYAQHPQAGETVQSVDTAVWDDVPWDDVPWDDVLWDDVLWDEKGE